MDEIQYPDILKVKIYWCNEDKIWIATSTNFNGLVLGHKSYDVLLKDIKRVLIRLFDIQNPVVEISTFS